VWLTQSPTTHNTACNTTHDTHDPDPCAERWTAYHEKRIRASFFMFYADLINGYQFSGDGNGNADESFIAVQPDSSKEFFEKFFGTEMWYSFVEERKKHGDDLFEDFINYRGSSPRLSALACSVLLTHDTTRHNQ
jgi:hypothetical protein